MIRRPLAFIACLFLVITIILMRIRPIRGNPPDSPGGTLLTVTGRVHDRQYKNDSFILILSDAIPNNDPSSKTSALCYLTGENLSLEKLPPMGSSVTVEGKLSFFEKATNPGQFDMREHYHIRGIDYRLLNSRILSYGKRYDILREYLFRLRLMIEKTYDTLLPGDDSGILKAMILGDKTDIDPDIKDLYQKNGIAHALAISGLHISILGYGFYRLLRKTGLLPVIAAISCTVFISLYSIMVGGSTSTVRAVIMFATCMLSDITGRTYDLLSALSLSLMVILFTDPLYIYDTGFMMSFGAVSGIALLSPVFRESLPFGKTKILSGFIASISVSIFTLPVTLFFFYEVSSYSTLLNLIVVPLMGVLVVSAILLALSGLFIPVLGIPCAFVCHLILQIYERGCLICQALPYPAVIAGRPATYKIIIYYLCILLLCVIQKGNPSKRVRKSHIIPSAALMLLPIILFLRSYDGLTYTMLDIGQGDCNVIMLDKGNTVMIDCGSSSVKKIGQYRVIPFLKYYGLRKLDTVVLTHMDSDHINGLEEILSMDRTGDIKIKRLMLPEKERPDEKYMALIKAAKEKGIETLFLSSGESFSIGRAQFFCLSPDKGFNPQDENEYSVVLKLTYGDFSGLFTGDIQGEGEDRMINRIKNEKPITVLKVSHHGSRNSTPESFLNIIKPSYSLISAGKNNRYRHPHSELMERLRNISSEIHVTKNEGAITVKTDGKKIKIKGEIYEN